MSEIKKGSRGGGSLPDCCASGGISRELSLSMCRVDGEGEGSEAGKSSEPRLGEGVAEGVEI